MTEFALYRDVVKMYEPDFCQKFTPYLDPETWINEDGSTNDWKDRSLVKNAPKSAINAFKQFKKLERKAEKKGILV